LFLKQIVVAAPLAVAQLNMATAGVAATTKTLMIRTLLNKIKTCILDKYL